MGLSGEKHYINYHRILSRVSGSGLNGAKQLLALLVSRLLGAAPLIIGLDDTLERRWGHRIWGLGITRDPVRSSQKYPVKCSGLKWVVMQMLVPLPWS
jgi:DDE superfamily endonuclease